MTTTFDHNPCPQTMTTCTCTFYDHNLSLLCTFSFVSQWHWRITMVFALKASCWTSEYNK